jgi:hypothetical protein
MTDKPATIPATDDFVERAKEQMEVARQLQGSPRSILMHIEGVESLLTRIDALKADLEAERKANAEKLTLDEIRTAIVAACGPCGGNGATVTTRINYGHACGGDERRCQTECPVPEPEQDIEQCEYCGRPVSTVEEFIKARAILAREKEGL